MDQLEYTAPTGFQSIGTVAWVPYIPTEPLKLVQMPSGGGASFNKQTCSYVIIYTVMNQQVMLDQFRFFMFSCGLN